MYNNAKYFEKNIKSYITHKKLYKSHRHNSLSNSKNNLIFYFLAYQLLKYSIIKENKFIMYHLICIIIRNYWLRKNKRRCFYRENLTITLLSCKEIMSMCNCDRPHNAWNADCFRYI